jgi:hypothetical protein
MRNFLKITWAWFVAFVLLGGLALFLWPSHPSETLLYLIYDGTRAGDKNQALGVANSLKEQMPENTIQIDFDLKNKDAFLTDVRVNLKPETKNKGVVLAAGVESIEVLKLLEPQSNVVIAHTSHQYTKEHSSLKEVADVVALPRSVVTPEIVSSLESPNTTLVQTSGVPHNLSPKLIKEAYLKNKDNFPRAENYIGIILGGDAETPDKKLLYYTKAEAQQMAEYIVPMVTEKKAHLLILNGPRTGKHDPATGKVIETSHRDGTVDAITTAFVETLKKQGLTQDMDFTVLDFQYEKPSAYPVVLGALYATNSPIFVAGESVSMVSESADCLPIGHVTAYTNKAMNESHKKYCLSEKEAGRINILETEGKKWQLFKAVPSDPTATQPASQTVALAIKKRLAEKANQ